MYIAGCCPNVSFNSLVVIIREFVLYVFIFSVIVIPADVSPRKYSRFWFAVSMTGCSQSIYIFLQLISQFILRPLSSLGTRIMG